MTASVAAEGLVCPRCHGPLAAEPGVLSCARCAERYPIDGRIVRFVGEDAFYEGAYSNVINVVPNGDPLDWLRLYFVDTHYLWWVRRHVARGARLLELGCGGGVRFFAAHARTTGVDLSLGSLRRLDADYELALQADALSLPIADGAYDAVASAYFYEHIALERRERLLAEIRRVLRPGGRLVCLFDVASDAPHFRWLRRDPARYRECFVEHDRHVGLETASANLERFRRAGFRVLRQHLANKTPWQYLAVYQWCRPYRHPVLDRLAAASEWVGRSPVAARAYTVALTLFDDLVEPLLPRNWARIMLVALERMD